MSVWRTRFIVLVVSVLGVGLVGLGAAPSADAVGAELYRTDQFGNKTSTITRVGNTNPPCCCISHGEGIIRLGVKSCYLPVP